MVESDSDGIPVNASAPLAELAADGVQIRALNEFATIWAVQQAKFGWLLGAGISASAGVPLANAIRDRLLFDRYSVEHKLIRQELDETDPSQVQRIHNYFDGRNGMPPLGSDGDYSAAFDLCLPDQSARKALLRDLIEHVKPGFGQRVFGGLVVAGACDLVITTNFDRLIEQGITEAQRCGTDLELDQQRDLNVAGIDSTARATVAIQERRWPLVVKLHGDFREKRLMNIDDELQAQDETLRQFVTDISRQFGLAISGYSGRDASVMRMLTDTVNTADAWPYGIWWFARPGSTISPTVCALLKSAAANGISANVVVAASFDETMTALSRQIVVDEYMRDYFNRLHPKPRVVPAAVPTPAREWPVLRFNALPILSAEVEATRVAIPVGWRRGDVRRAMHPRRAWPVVVNGPGEVLSIGDPEAALTALSEAAIQHKLPEPGPAQTISLGLLADNAPLHHQTVLLQALAHALQHVLPLWMRTDRGGAPELIVTAPSPGEPMQFRSMRTKLTHAYQDHLFGHLAPEYGKTNGNKNRRWAEKIELSFERRAGRPWLLFRPYTWIAPLPQPTESEMTKRADPDPANPWRAERWAQRRFNEKWAAIIDAWTSLLAPDETTERSVISPGTTASVGRIVLGRTNAFSRSA